MESQRDKLYNLIEDDSIDIVLALKNVWNEKKLVIKVVCISFVVGCILAMLSPILYVSQTTFVPQISDKSTINKSLGSIASLAGINLNTDSGTAIDNYLSPLLYSKIIDSDEFSMSLVNEQLVFMNGDVLTIKEYLTSDSNKINLLALIKKYTIGIFSSSKNKKQIIPSEFLEEYNFINEDDYSIINRFRNKFSIEVNEKEGYIKVIASDKNAFVSTQLVKLVTKNLQSRIISLRTNKIKGQLDYSKEEYFKKKNEFEVLQKNLAEFKDANKNISTAIFLSELEKLQSEYQLQQNILMSLASEYNNNKIKLNKNTPIFSVLDEVSVPNVRSKPKRKQIVIIYTLLGLFVSILYLLAKNPVKEFLKLFKEN